MKPAAAPGSLNLVEYFLDRHIEEGRAGKIALTCGDTSLTYQDLLEQAQRAAAGLALQGVERGDRVLILLPDSAEFVAAFFGAIRIGAVAVPCNTSLRTADYSGLIEQSRPEVLVAHSSLIEVLKPLLGSAAHVIVAGERHPSYTFWNDWLKAQSPNVPPAPASKGDTAFWLWTSGSTGPPKAAVHRHADWMHCCECYGLGVLGIHSGDVTFSSSKLFHAYGLGNGLMFPFYAGASTVLYSGRPQARAVLQTAHDRRPTLFFSVPTLFAAMLQETDAANPYHLDSVRLGISAAEPLPAEIFRRWRERFGFEVLDGIGSTEVLHIYVSSRPGCVKAGSTGQPVPGYDVRIVDEHRNPVAPGRTGDLWVRGPSLASGYWSRPDLTAERFHDGWFFTGDKYYADAEGYLWYAGRSDDMFRVSGEWVSPFELESVLMAHPAVLEAAVVPWEDEHKLLKPKACIVLKNGWPRSEDLIRELQQSVREQLAGYKYPRKIEFWDELPKTVTGKIQRYKLRTMN